jgi:hypothetical protein
MENDILMTEGLNPKRKKERERKSTVPRTFSSYPGSFVRCEAITTSTSQLGRLFKMHTSALSVRLANHCND